MKKLVSLAAISLFGFVAATFAAGDKDTLIDKEEAIWQTVQDKNPDAFRKYFAMIFGQSTRKELTPLKRKWI